VGIGFDLVGTHLNQNPMKRCVLSVLTLIALSIQLPAQEIDFERWEVGIDLLTLIGRNQVVPSFFVKKLDLKQKRKGTGFIRRGPRLRTGISVNTVDRPFPINHNLYDFLIRPGYEWDKQIKSVDIILALDFVASFQNIYSYDYYSGISNYRNRDYRFGPSPVVGISYRIVKNIKVTAESALDLLFRNTRTHYEFSNGSEPLTISTNGIVVNASPLYVLNAVFVF
jgi:hypothetical protein